MTGLDCVILCQPILSLITECICFCFPAADASQCCYQSIHTLMQPSCQIFYYTSRGGDRVYMSYFVYVYMWCRGNRPSSEDLRVEDGLMRFLEYLHSAQVCYPAGRHKQESKKGLFSQRNSSTQYYCITYLLYLL